MSLAARRKPNVYHKKRNALHHRQSKSYLKTYWPYLPLFAILATGAVINKLWAVPAKTLVGSAGPSSLPLATSRIQLITGNYGAWLTSAMLLIAAVSLSVFLIRHSLQLQRVVVRGEDFISHHPMLDIAIAFIFTAGFVLSSSSAVMR